MPAISVNDPTAYSNDVNKPTNGAIVLADLNTIITQVNLTTTAVDGITTGAYTLPGPITFTNGIATNTITEKASPGNTGVTVDGLLIKDGYIGPTLSSDPTSPANSALWYLSTNHVFKAQINGAAQLIIGRDGLYVPTMASDPSSPTPSNGQIWYNSTSHVFKGRINGVNTTFAFLTRTAYNSGNQTITTAGTLTLAHGLGAVPDSIFVWLICQTGEFNYVANDRILIGPYGTGSPADYGVGLTVDATNIVCRYASLAAVFYYGNKNTGANSNLTNGNWRMLITAARYT